MTFCSFGLSLLLICFSTTGADAQVVIGQKHGIHSAVLKEERNYRVYLPDSYAWAKDRRYPVLYVLSSCRPSSGRTVQTGSECFLGFLQVGCLLCIA
jgi:hypothetical protein